MQKSPPNLWEDSLFYSFPFIFSNLNSSTISIGENIRSTISNICCFGSNVMLNIPLRCDVNSIININDADTSSASSNFVLLNGFVLNNDLWLFLILNKCTNSESDNT